MLNFDYISLKEAAKYCDYSQDYLKLRARQGKLKAVKIGRNWLTTPQWVGEYTHQRFVTPRTRSKGVQIVPKSRKKINFYKTFQLCGIVACAGLMAYLVFLLVDVGYLGIGWFDMSKLLATIGSYIPGKVLEIR